MAVMENKWVEKKWKDPKKYVMAKPEDGDSTPHVLKREGAPDIKITYTRANRVKTLRGIRKA